jgi:ketosteroid isomerase-like protein
VSGENIEFARRALEAFNAHDTETWIAYLDPSVEYHSAITVPGGAVYHGHDGVRRYLRDFRDAWGDDFHVEAEAFYDLGGEQIMMFYSVHGRGQQSGAEVAMPGAQVSRWRDGLLVYAKVYVRRKDALEELGVSEDALEPIVP